jgi:hypothetical protein
MVTANTPIAPAAVETSADIQWSSVIAGAICASALAFVLHAFAGAVGISLTSTAPTWRDSSAALVLLSGLYLVLVASASYGFGAYIAARLRVPSATTSDISEFRNGVDGLLVWALATLLTGLIALAVAQAAPHLATPSGSSEQTTVVGENIISYDLDRLFRSERRPQGLLENINYPRAEAARILLTASSHRGMQTEDRNYLVRLVATVTGLAPPDAERRVDQVTAQAKDNISRARRTGVILGFMVGAAALLGAAVAWYVASETGRYRDNRQALHPFWDWGRSVSRDGR